MRSAFRLRGYAAKADESLFAATAEYSPLRRSRKIFEKQRPSAASEPRERCGARAPRE
jgi:hypothetical protein